MDARLRDRAVVRPHRDLTALGGGARIALVHDWLTGLRGGEKCLEVLCEAFPRATVHTLIHQPGSVGPIIGGMSIRTSPMQRIPGVGRHYRKLLPIMPMAARSWDVGSVDLVVSLSHCVAKAVRVPRGVPHVCYCFTPMRYAWEGRSAYLDSWRHRPIRRRAAGWMLDRLRRWDRGSASGVSHFVAISKTIQGRIRQCYGRDSVVIEPPVDTGFYSPAPVDREHFYLCVSALVPYKKVEHAIRACSITGNRLVVIGSGPDRDRLERMAGPSVTFLGWQSDEVIRDHYRRCLALLFPGEEDFGIVPVEAMACGSAVIAYNAGGASETVSPTAGVLYDEASAEGLAQAIARWEASGRPYLASEARQRAEGYARPRFRDRLLGHLADVLAGSSGHHAPPAPHLDRLQREAGASRIHPQAFPDAHRDAAHERERIPPLGG